MCVRESELHSALAVVVRGLDPDAVADPAALWKTFDQIARLAGAAKTLLARRVDAAEVWRDAGFRSAAEFLAVQAGGSVAEARRALETCERLTSAPATAAALRSGGLS